MGEDLGAQSTIYLLVQKREGAGFETTLAPRAGAARAAEDAAPLEPSALGPGRYATRGSLGEGGMGRVDWVWDADLMRDLAVKQVSDALADDPLALARFLWEARVTAHLDHPNVVPVHDLGMTPAGRPFYTMKRVVGATLAEVNARLADGEEDARRRYPVPRRLRLFLQICNAVAPALVAIVERAMAFRPEDRYPTVAALREDVETALDGGTPSAEKASMARRLARFAANPDPRLSQVRIWVLELLFVAAHLIGGGIGVVAAPYLPRWLGWLSLGAGLAISTPLLGQWLGRRRARRDAPAE